MCERTIRLFKLESSKKILKELIDNPEKGTCLSYLKENKEKKKLSIKEIKNETLVIDKKICTTYKIYSF